MQEQVTAYDDWRALCAGARSEPGPWAEYRGPVAELHASDAMLRWLRIADVPVLPIPGTVWFRVPAPAYRAARAICGIAEQLPHLREVVLTISVLRDGPDRCEAELALRALATQ